MSRNTSISFLLLSGLGLLTACGEDKPAETGGTTGATADAAPPAEDAAPATSATMDPNIAKPYGAPPAHGLLV